MRNQWTSHQQVELQDSPGPTESLHHWLEAAESHQMFPLTKVQQEVLPRAQYQRRVLQKVQQNQNHPRQRYSVSTIIRPPLLPKLCGLILQVASH